jgi:hypothetical protein
MDKEKDESGEAKRDTWAEDQQRRDYYYDDSHGYEIYNPDAEDEDGDEDEQVQNQ